MHKEAASRGGQSEVQKTGVVAYFSDRHQLNARAQVCTAAKSSMAYGAASSGNAHHRLQRGGQRDFPISAVCEQRCSTARHQSYTASVVAPGVSGWNDRRVSKSGPVTSIAAFAVDRTGRRTVELQSAPQVCGASVTKPLLAWVAASQGLVAREDTWADLARDAITISDNDATAELWSLAGESELLAALNDVLGTTWRIGEGDEHPALRIMVTAIDLARAYAALMDDHSRAGAQVRHWMLEVRPEQTFDLRAVACDTLAVTEDTVGVKCGWFGGERAHAVVVVETERTSLGAVVLTSRVPDATTRAAARAASGDDTKLIALHEQVAGEGLRIGIRSALLVAADL